MRVGSCAGGIAQRGISLIIQWAIWNGAGSLAHIRPNVVICPVNDGVDSHCGGPVLVCWGKVFKIGTVRVAAPDADKDCLDASVFIQKVAEGRLHLLIVAGNLQVIPRGVPNGRDHASSELVHSHNMATQERRAPSLHCEERRASWARGAWMPGDEPFLAVRDKVFHFAKCLTVYGIAGGPQMPRGAH